MLRPFVEVLKATLADFEDVLKVYWAILADFEAISADFGPF